MDALSAAGVPVYVERGVNGGCSLLEGYRSNLTGLTREEVKALFMLGIPASLDELGVSQEVRAALRKLTASLPADRHQSEQTVLQRVYVDWSDWSASNDPKPCLQEIYQATRDDRELHLAYTEMIGPLEEQFERSVNPYGLVAKGSEWYLVCADDERTYVYRVSRVLKAETTGTRFERPIDFDLLAFWKSWYAEQGTRLPSYPILVRIAAGLARLVNRGYEVRLFEAIGRGKTVDSDGSVRTYLVFETFKDARSYVLSFGSALEVLEPAPLRQSVADFARQTLSLYSDA